MVPIVSIVETIQVTRERVNAVASGGQVFRLRDDYLPIVRLHSLFDIEPDYTDLLDVLLMIVEADGKRVGLFVDELMSQRRSSSEPRNQFQAGHRLRGHHAGDGRVALILDIPGDHPIQAPESAACEAAGRMSSTNASGALEAVDTQQFLTFKLAGEEYGVGILTVQGDPRLEQGDQVPHTPTRLLGVINLAGWSFPSSTTASFNFATANTTTPRSSSYRGHASSAWWSMVDVITLAAAQIKPAPSLGTGADTSHIIGFGTLDERMRILMDVEKLMAGADMGLVDKAIH